MSNRNPDVEQWLAGYDNPHKDLVLALREHILNSDDRIAEAIKWNAPTFVYEGNIATFNPRSMKNVSLMFHTGAQLDDGSGLLDGDGPNGRVLRIASAEDLAAKKDAIAALFARWIELRG